MQKNPAKKSCKNRINPIFYKNSMVFWTFPSLTAAPSSSPSSWTTTFKVKKECKLLRTFYLVPFPYPNLSTLARDLGSGAPPDFDADFDTQDVCLSLDGGGVGVSLERLARWDFFFFLLRKGLIPTRGTPLRKAQPSLERDSLDRVGSPMIALLGSIA